MPNNSINSDKILIFDLKGPMAHFRKYYTNSSSLSYLFPPRTVVAGLVAGLLGIPNEKEKNINNRYYEMFSNEKCFIAISLRTKIRKIMQTVNYKRTKWIFEVDGSGGCAPIPLEILIPEDTDEKDTDEIIYRNEIIYRIYFWHNDNQIYSQLKQKLENQSSVYPTYMGLTEFLASIEYVGEGKITPNTREKEIKLNTPCRAKDVNVSFENNKNQWYIIEKMPTGFSNERVPTPPCDYLAVPKGCQLTVKVKENSSSYSVEYIKNRGTQIENIMPL